MGGMNPVEKSSPGARGVGGRRSGRDAARGRRGGSQELTTPRTIAMVVGGYGG